MKNVMVVFGDRGNSQAIDFILNNLNEIFLGYADFQPVFLTELPSDTVLEADAYVVNHELYYNGLRPFVADYSRVVKMRRFPHKRALELTAHIPRNSDVLVVNDRFVSSLETSYQLIDYPISDLNFIPFDPAQPSGTYGGIATAITVGEPDMVPSHIKNVIDIGYRLIGSETILHLIYILGLDVEPVHRNMFRQFDQLLESDSQYMDSYESYYLQAQMLKHVNEASPQATLLMDANFRILYANAKAREIFGVTEAQDIRLQDYIDISSLKSDDTDSRDVEIKTEDYVYDKYAINIQDDTIGYYIHLQEKRIASPHKDALKQKGYYARYNFKDITYRSKKMENVVSMAKRLALSGETVLIRGESGTGKELIAQSLHNYSNRRTGPFVAINCAALPETLLESELFGYEPGSFTGARSKGKVGLFEQANKGTIFLDEIGDVSPRLQSRLLRTIQEMQVMKIGSDKVIDIDVRIICATNKNLEEAIENGDFRRDLFYRINVLPLIIPPLRERKDDILPLLKNFLGSGFKSVTSQEKAILVAHNWPGNVRELRNVSLYYNSLHQLPEYLKSSSRSDYSMDANIGTPISSALTPAVLPQVSQAGAKYDEPALKLHLLFLIYQYTEPAHGLGRTGLVQLMKQSGINISDGKLRIYLSDLESAGLIEIGKGRYGTRITQDGIDYLKEKEMPI